MSFGTGVVLRRVRDGGALPHLERKAFDLMFHGSYQGRKYIRRRTYFFFSSLDPLSLTSAPSRTLEPRVNPLIPPER